MARKSSGKTTKGKSARGKSTRQKAAKRRPRRASKARRARDTRRARWLAVSALVLALGLWVVLAAFASGRRAVAILAEDLEGVPVQVLAMPRVLRVGEPASLAMIHDELRAAGYSETADFPRHPGEFRTAATRLELYRRAHEGPSGAIAAAFARVDFDGAQVASVRSAKGDSLEVFSLEPVPLGAFRGDRLLERRPLAYEEFPEQLVAAVVATEDQRFFRHRGLDPRAILRAAWVDITGRGVLQGGSTITQQVIKNRVVGSERTLMRKAREAFLAAWVEGRVSKERLLEIYLNEVYLGQRGAVSVLGMPAAARHYFGRNVQDLDLKQCALLAGMISSPGRYDPRRHPERAQERASWVIGRLLATEEIEEVEAAAARETPLEIAPLPDAMDRAGDLLDTVARELEARGAPPRPGQRATRVYTSIEPALQASARRALRETLEHLERERRERAPLEGAVIVLRPATGAIAAIVGGREGVRGRFNRALQARRQPGSSFKPFVALAAFEERSWGPAHRLRDEPLSLPTPQGTWRPRNADGIFRGEVTLRRALEESLNVPMARLGEAVGADRVAHWARAAGAGEAFASHPSLALGTEETTPLALATGYLTLARLGERIEPWIVREVRSEVRDEGFLPRPLAGTRVQPDALSRGASWMVLDALTGSVERGTARAIGPLLRGRSVAAKTGTSQQGRDGWFVLVSGNAVVLAWVGRDDAKPARLSGPSAALPVVRRLLEATGEELLGPLPEPPESVVVGAYDPDKDCLGRSIRSGRVREVFPRDAAPRSCGGSFLRRLFGSDDETGR